MRRLLCCCLVAFPTTATANDTVTRLDNGGLVFAKTDAVEIRSEDLFTSEKLIRVRYRFFNRTDRDLTTLVAFPLPDLGPQFAVSNVSVAGKFTTTIDGRAIEPRIEQKVISADGRDRTDLLRRLSVPFDLTKNEAEERLRLLPDAQQEELARLGLVRRGDPNPHTKPFILPDWTVKTAYYWEQTFPTEREITVEHSYRPSVGWELGIGLHYEVSEKTEWSSDDMQRYCMDASFIAAADHIRKNQKLTAALPYNQGRIDYILTTGGNWAGPIHRFRLVIDKGRPENLVTFCGDGVRKISATQFEMRKTDFTPTSDLHILLIKKNRP
jgi:hypothetical protein